MKTLILSIFLASLSAPGLTAGSMENACMRAQRDAATPALCGCIQDAANLTLSGSDQKLAVSFFKNPQKAQDIRQSGTPRNSSFWARYKQFGQVAKEFCVS